MSVYLDYNASAPVREAVVEAMIPHLREEHGNPSSAHSYGFRAADAVARARKQVAALIGAEPESIIFVSGGTEANIMVLSDVLQKRSGSLVIAEFEHPSIYNSAARLEKEGVSVISLPILKNGIVNLEYLQKIIENEISLVSVMTANNETGVLQPVADISRICHQHNVLFHTDAAQAVGKVHFSVTETNADFATIAAHKMGGPLGVGALYIKPGYEMGRIFEGGSQEKDLRPGTESVPAIVGFGAACEIAATVLTDESRRIASIRDILEEMLLATVSGVSVNGGQSTRLPNTSNLAIPGCDAATLVARLDRAGFAISSGSACHAGGVIPSRTIAAMGLQDVATSSLRISLGPDTNISDIEKFTNTLSALVAEERKS